MPPASVYDSSRRRAGGWSHRAGSDEEEGYGEPSSGVGRSPQSRASSRAWVEDSRGGAATPHSRAGTSSAAAAPTSPGAASLEARLQALREQVQRTRDALDTGSGENSPAASSVVSVPELAVKGGALFMEGKPVDNVHQKVRARVLRGAVRGVWPTCSPSGAVFPLSCPTPPLGTDTRLAAPPTSWRRQSSNGMDVFDVVIHHLLSLDSASRPSCPALVTPRPCGCRVRTTPHCLTDSTLPCPCAVELEKKEALVTHRLAQLEMSTGLVAQPLSTDSPQQSRRSRTSQSSGGSGSRRRGDDEDEEEEEGRTPPSSGRRSGRSSRRVAWGDDGPVSRAPPAAGAGLFGFMADIIGGTCNVASAALDGASRQRGRTPVEDVDDEDDHKRRGTSSTPARRRGLVSMVQQAVDPTEAQLASIRRMRACSVLNPAAALAASRKAAAAAGSGGAGAVPPVRVPSEREQQLEHIHDGAPAARPAAQAPVMGSTPAPRPTAARRKPRRILYDSETEDDTEDEMEEGLLSQDDDITVDGSDHSGSHFTGDSSEEERWSRAMGRTGTEGAATPGAVHDAALPPELLAAQSALARVQQTETGPLAEDALRLPPPPPPVRLRASRTPTAQEAALPEVLGLPPLRPPPKQHATEQVPPAGSTVSRGGRLKGSSSRQSGPPPPPPPPSTLLSSSSSAGPARPLLTQMRAPSVASTTWQVPASLNPPGGKDRRVRF